MRVLMRAGIDTCRSWYESRDLRDCCWWLLVILASERLPKMQRRSQRIKQIGKDIIFVWSVSWGSCHYNLITSWDLMMSLRQLPLICGWNTILHGSVHILMRRVRWNMMRCHLFNHAVVSSPSPDFTSRGVVHMMSTHWLIRCRPAKIVLLLILI